MTNEVSPSLSYHYWMLCVNGTATDPTPSILVRGTDFDPSKEITQEDDEGHTGSATVKIATYRSNATSSPTFQDKCRYQEGFEDILYLTIGSDDGTSDHDIDKTTVQSGVFQYVFSENPSSPLPAKFATLTNGFNKSTDGKDAYKYKNALLNTFKFSGTNTDAPTYEAGFMSDFPLFHQQNPARTFPQTSYFPKSGNTRLYIAPLGTSFTDLSSTMEFSCYENWEVNVNKNVENKPCAGDTFGTSTKVTGSREGDFSCTLPYNTRSANLEYEFMGGDTERTTTTVTDKDIHKTIYIVMTGGNIIRSSTSSTTSTGESLVKTITVGNTTTYLIDTGKQFQTIFKIPDVVLTNVNSPQSGSDAKTVDVEASIVDNNTDSFIHVTVQTGLEDLHISNAL